MPHSLRAACPGCISPSWPRWPLEAYGLFCLGSRYKVMILIFNKHTRIYIFRRLLSSSKMLDPNSTATFQNSFGILILMKQKSFLTRDMGSCHCRQDQGSLGNLLSLSENVQPILLSVSLTPCLPRASFHNFKNTKLSSGMSTAPASGDRTNRAACLGNWPGKAQWLLITQSSGA